MLQAEAASLNDLLKGREKRAARQRELLGAYAGSLICLTVNYPGEVKRNETVLRVFNAGLAALDEALMKEAVLFKEAHAPVTGPEGYRVVDVELLKLKALTCAVEETHPLGRLFDIDVIGRDFIPVSRAQAGFMPRTCLICGGDTTVCRREKRHPLPELLSRIEEMVQDL